MNISFTYNCEISMQYLKVFVVTLRSTFPFVATPIGVLHQMKSIKQKPNCLFFSLLSAFGLLTQSVFVSVMEILL